MRDVEMYGRAPRTPGDDASEDEGANERTPLSGQDPANPWLHRRGGSRYAAAPGAERGRAASKMALRSCSLRGTLQALGLWRSEVRYLPRRIPLDGTLSAAAAVSPGARGGEDEDEGLAAALAVRNVVRNQKYRAATFVFAVLYEQFRYFFNLYFLLVALSQLIPELQVGFLFTYIAPLVFVLSITLAKEASDDYQRYVRDKESNSQRYDRLMADGRIQSVPSSEIRVGDVIFMPAGARVPADMVLLRTTDKSGAVFIRTDQLDGETDWKLRRTIAVTQGLPSDEALCRVRATVYADAPNKEIDQFVGTFTLHAVLGHSSSSPQGDNFVVVDPGGDNRNGEAGRTTHESGGRWGVGQSGEEVQGGGAGSVGAVEPLTIENTLWANTVVCGGGALGLVMYTGTETRVAMNCDPPKSKVGLVDLEINRLAKMLFLVSLVISVTMVSSRSLLGGACLAVLVACHSSVQFFHVMSVTMVALLAWRCLSLAGGTYRY
jgi:magnesium-transporting ATPase (P-type)